MFFLHLSKRKVLAHQLLKVWDCFKLLHAVWSFNLLSIQVSSPDLYIYISVETQQASYNILFINKLFHAFMQSSVWIYIYIFRFPAWINIYISIFRFSKEFPLYMTLGISCPFDNNKSDQGWMRYPYWLISIMWTQVN